MARRYHTNGRRVIGFVGLPAVAVDTSMVSENLGGIRRSVNASLKGKDSDDSETIKNAMDELASTLQTVDDPLEWAGFAIEAIDSFTSVVGPVDPGIPNNRGDRLATIEAHARDNQRDGEAHGEAKRFLRKMA